MDFIKKNGMGILWCGIFAGVATVLSTLKIGSFSLEIIGAPVFAILLGMILNLLIPNLVAKEKLKLGIAFTSKKILQLAVVILGFSLNLNMILTVGSKSLPIIVSTICTSLVVAMILMKVMKVDKRVACLIGVGSSICGGSAIAATAPVINANDEEVAQSISVIFLFNILAALIFPVLGYKLGLGTEGFAVFAGTAVNDTSSVTAAAAAAENIYGVSGILSAAVTVKLTRTLAIIPITLILAFIRTKNAKKQGGVGSAVSLKEIFPWFILYFVGAAVITTIMGLLPENAFSVFYNDVFVSGAKLAAKFFIAMAMCAIGLNTNIANLIKKGGKPILLGLACWLAIIAVSLWMQQLMGIFGTNI